MTTEPAPANSKSSTVPHVGLEGAGELSQMPAKGPTRTALIVIGMHRSGTSALAGMLARLGCDLPATEMPATQANARGFYESKEIYNLNNGLLADMGIDWTEWLPIDPAWSALQTGDVRRRIAETLEKEFGSASLFVIKDPRMCRLLPIWQPLLDERGTKTIYVHTHRNPMEVARSMAKRKGIPIPLAGAIWLRYMLDGEAATRSRGRVFTSYSELLSDWRSAADRIESGLGLRLPSRSADAERSVDEFLSEDLKSINVKLDGPNETQDGPAFVQEVFEIFERWVTGGETARDRARLDEINAEFTRASIVLGPLAKSLANENSSLRRTVQNSQAGRKDSEEQATDDRGKREALAKDVATLLERLANLEGTTPANVIESPHDADPESASSDSDRDASQSAGIDAANSLGHPGDEAAASPTTAPVSDQVSTKPPTAYDRGRSFEAELRLARDAASPMQTRALAELRDRLETRDREIADIRGENRVLLEQIDSRYKELAQMSKLVKSLEDSFAEHRRSAGAELSVTKTEVVRLKGELKSHRSRLAEMTRNFESVRTERDHYFSAANSFRSSTSWKLTAPLRWLADGLKSVRR